MFRGAPNPLWLLRGAAGRMEGGEALTPTLGRKKQRKAARGRDRPTIGCRGKHNRRCKVSVLRPSDEVDDRLVGLGEGDVR